jgi:septin family protein
MHFSILLIGEKATGKTFRINKIKSENPMLKFVQIDPDNFFSKTNLRAVKKADVITIHDCRFEQQLLDISSFLNNAKKSFIIETQFLERELSDKLFYSFTEVSFLNHLRLV